MLRLRVILILVIVMSSGAPVAWACLWDRDTLAAEAKGVPGVVEIIVGRFERNPPLYYEMRLTRVTKELEAKPDDLALYDDAGVACDRLGRADEAIEWMKRKRAALDALATPDKEHEYRYYANLGTFHAHRWFKSGANREQMSDLELARDLIRHAIELNPDAHFGREKYQLMVIEWIITGHITRESDGHRYVPSPIPGGHGVDSRDAIDGLRGLISLGAAWRSVDVFRSLRDHLAWQGHGSMAYLAQARLDELGDAGTTALFADDSDYGVDARPGVDDPDIERVRKYYAAARESADAWHEARSEFMLSRMRDGQHPDTHPEFWSGWSDEPMLPPAPDVSNSAQAYANQGRNMLIALTLVGVVGMVIAAIFTWCCYRIVSALIVWHRRRRAA